MILIEEIDRGKGRSAILIEGAAGNQSMELRGALIIDKPAGMTSHDVVARVRRLFKTRRVGHAGTLDPFATGVLVVCVGNATRLTQFLVGLDKRYTATIRFGYATDSHDITGKRVTAIESSKVLRVEDIAKVLVDFIGPQLQMPPMYSAKKVAGERLYRAAREGRVVERQACPITIHSLSLLDGPAAIVGNADGTTDAVVRVHCSSGTYIRRLAHDIGERLQIGAHLVALRRESVGPHHVGQAVPLAILERLEQPDQTSAFLLSPADAIKHMPKLEVTEDEILRIRNGRQLELDRVRLGPLQPGEVVGLCDRGGELQAVGELMAEPWVLKPRMVLTV
jgi:tRNA pseudouridine55 synthase